MWGVRATDIVSRCRLTVDTLYVSYHIFSSKALFKDTSEAVTGSHVIPSHHLISGRTSRQFLLQVLTTT